MARYIPGLKAKIQRACSKHPEGADSSEETEFDSDQARGSPLAARHLQEAIVGSTLMYGSEIAWRGRRVLGRAFQKNINRMSRSSLGVLSSTPVAFLQAEGGSTPAVARLDRRQEAFAIKLASTTTGPHTGLIRATTGLGRRLGEMLG